MTDNTYKEEINDILFYLNSNRETGRTNRKVNEIVEKLFNFLVNTKIYVVDHYNSTNTTFVNGKVLSDISRNVKSASTEADKMLLNKVIKRLSNEHKNVKFEFSQLSNPIWIRRVSKTNRELMQERLEELKSKL